MIPLHLKLSGFLSYRDPAEVDFTRFHLACISGSNGAGKSSLLDAMTWALFGQARKKDESLINLQSKTAEVAYTFAYEAEIYRVLRALARGKTGTLEFQVAEGGDPKVSLLEQQLNWRPLTERTSRDTQRRIEDILRLDYETFINVSFFLQGRADQFAQQAPARRKEILGSILGLEIWDEYKERAAERRKSVERELDSLDDRLKENSAELDEEPERKQRLKDLQAELKRTSALVKSQRAAVEALKKAAASQLAAEKATLEQERLRLQEQENTAAADAKAVDEMNARVDESKKSLEEIEAKITRKGELEKERSEARERAAELKAENEHLKGLMDELKTRLGQLEAAEGATCPLCGQALSEAHRRSTLKQLNAEGKEKGDRFRTNKAAQDELSKKISGCELHLAKLGDPERERLQTSTSITQLSERIETMKASLKKWEQDGVKRLKEVEKLLANEKFAREEQKPGGDIREAERALSELQAAETSLNQEVGGAQQKVHVLDELKKRQKRLASEREDAARQAGRYRTLERAFGRDGVPALLIEQALPEIEAKANELLDRLSDGSMSVRFATQAAYKDRKREDLKETLDIQISDGAGVRDYEMYSGGEAFRANFAIRLALSEVLASRTGARLQMLVIDEGFGSQDEQGRQRLIQSINAVQNDFAKVLVITHLDELKDAFPSRIEVEKGAGGSVVKVL